MPSIYPEAPPVSGLVAGKYELVRIIGRGGMGSVWEGKHATLGKRVAIKFIDAEYAQNDEARSRFENEARAAAAIQSRHAIEIFDHGVTDDRRPYIVMELLVGEALDKRIDRVGRITLAETARIVGQVCRALQRAHDAGVVHRDLKPENIFLVRAPDEDDEIAKVLDFGIAKIQRTPGDGSAPHGISSTTKTGAVLGTPYYMSPEQARGLRSVDYRTDLWSLGVIAYKCVTGVLPFEGESLGDLLVKICTGPVPVPSRIAPELPSSFDAWFARALEREPAHRFASAQELADGLAFAAGVSVRRGSPSAHAPAMSAATPGSSSANGPAPAMTAAPFTRSSSAPSRPARGIVAAAVAASVIGVTVGAVAFTKLAHDKPRAAGVASATAAAAKTAPPPAESASATGTPSSSASAQPPAGAPSAAPSTSASSKPRPASPATPSRGAPAPTLKPLPPRPAPPPPADPGY